MEEDEVKEESRGGEEGGGETSAELERENNFETWNADSGFSDSESFVAPVLASQQSEADGSENLEQTLGAGMSNFGWGWGDEGRASPITEAEGRAGRARRGGADYALNMPDYGSEVDYENLRAREERVDMQEDITRARLFAKTEDFSRREQNINLQRWQEEASEMGEWIRSQRNMREDYQVRGKKQKEKKSGIPLLD